MLREIAHIAFKHDVCAFVYENTGNTSNIWTATPGRLVNPKSANEISKKADLILTFGVRFSPKIISKDFGKNAKIISIDIDKKELEHSLKKIDIKIL